MSDSGILYLLRTLWGCAAVAARAAWLVPTEWVRDLSATREDIAARRGARNPSATRVFESHDGAGEGSATDGKGAEPESASPAPYPSSATPPVLDDTPSGRPSPLLLYSQVPWDDVWQRPQEMASGLSRFRPVCFFGPVQAQECAERLRGRWKALRRGPTAGKGDLTVASPRLFPGEYKSPLIRRLNRALIAAEARRAARRLAEHHGGGLVFATNSPFCDYLAARLRPRAVVFDVMDDFAAFDWAPPDARRRELNLLRAAHLVFAGTQTLLDKKGAGHPNAHFVACGVDFERFAAGKNQPEPPELAGLPRPILGFMGTISDRLDRGLLEALARRFERASIVLLGPVHGSFGPRIDLPNIHYLGLRSPEALAAYVARFDVALMPFAQTEAARAINPVKTLEYLAAGRRVISTPIPDVERFHGDLVIVAPAVEPFLDGVARLLEETDDARVRRGVERARARSWAAMAEDMERKIREVDQAGR